MATNERGHTIVASERYHTDGSCQPIIIALDDEGYITIYDSKNSYSTYFHIDEYTTYYNLLEQAYDHQEYDEDYEDYYYPDEIFLEKDEILWQFDVTFNNEYKGNWIYRDRIYKVEKALIDFKDRHVKSLTIEDIKAMMPKLNKLSWQKLMSIKINLQAIKEAKDGAETTV